MTQSQSSTILADIEAAAQELLREQPMIIPIAGDFTIVQMTRLTPTAIDYRVFASRTFIATVRLRPAYDPSRNKPPQVFIVPGAFNHDYTTSVRLRKLINALYVAASPNSNQKAIQTLRDENVTYWGDDIIVL